MNYTRALGFSLLLYVSGFFVLPFINREELSLGNFVFIWAFYVPIVLLLAKWFFRKVPASIKNGFVLGIFAIGIASILDGIFVYMVITGGESRALFKELYSSWMFYVTVIEIIALTTYAGFEFDKTYTKRDVKKKAK